MFTTEEDLVRTSIHVDPANVKNQNNALRNFKQNLLKLPNRELTRREYTFIHDKISSTFASPQTSMRNTPVLTPNLAEKFGVVSTENVK